MMLILLNKLIFIHLVQTKKKKKSERNLKQQNYTTVQSSQIEHKIIAH